MAEASDSNMFRQYLSSVMADSRASDFAKTMAKYGMSQLERRENNFKRSMELLDEVIASLPGQPLLQTDKGVLLYAAGDFEGARTVLESACQADAKDMYAVFNLGKAYQALGDINKAEDRYRTVSYELPEYPKVYFELGKIASQKKQNNRASLLLGKFYLYEGKLDLARFSLEKLAEDTSVNNKEHAEAETLLETIERIEK
jgi:predicted Zn-dependent protease